MAKKRPGREAPEELMAMDEIDANIAVIAGVRRTLVDELAEITRLTNEHIAACDAQIALLRAEKANRKVFADRVTKERVGDGRPATDPR